MISATYPCHMCVLIASTVTSPGLQKQWPVSRFLWARYEAPSHTIVTIVFQSSPTRPCGFRSGSNMEPQPSLSNKADKGLPACPSSACSEHAGTRRRKIPSSSASKVHPTSSLWHWSGRKYKTLPGGTQSLMELTRTSGSKQTLEVPVLHLRRRRPEVLVQPVALSSYVCRSVSETPAAYCIVKGNSLPRRVS